MASRRRKGMPSSRKTQTTLDIDRKTGLRTYSQYVEDLPAALEAANSDSPLAMLVADVDDLKAVNSKAGHEGGDRAIQMVARHFELCTARKGTVYRNSDAADEFIILLPNHTMQEAVAVAERCRAGVATLEHPDKISLSVTVGVSAYPVPCQDAQQLFVEADNLLIKGKEAKEKNRVHSKTMASAIASLEDRWRLTVTVEPESPLSIQRQSLLDELLRSCYSIPLDEFGRRGRYPLYKDQSNLVTDHEDGWIGAKNDQSPGHSDYFEISTRGAVRYVLEKAHSANFRNVQGDIIIDGLSYFLPFALRFVSKRRATYVVKLSIEGIQNALLSLNQQIRHAVDWTARGNKGMGEILWQGAHGNLFLRDAMHVIALEFSPNRVLSINDLRASYFENVWNGLSAKVRDQSEEDE
jgi:diguanylate cyclase (GGDEF)-like protein